MTPRELTFEALDYIGVATITAAGGRKLARIARDITAALQYISTEAPELYKIRRGQAIIASETVSVTVAAGLINVTSAATFVNGCTIRIDGDEAWNEIRIESAQKKLLMPYSGAEGTYNATLYHDVLLLDADAGELLGRPLVEGYGFLAKAVNRKDLIEFPRESQDFGRRTRGASSAIQRMTAQRPTHFWVESGYAVDHTNRFRLRLYPIPMSAGQISYDIRVLARTLAVADLGTDAADSTFVLPIQEDYHQSLLRPIFLEQWAGGPWFREEDQKRSIKEDAQRARLELKKFKPQRASNRRLRAPL